MSSYLSKPPSMRGTGMLTVPVTIVRTVPDDAKFECELTDDGILFRFIGIVPRDGGPPRRGPIADPPAWTKNGANG